MKFRDVNLRIVTRGRGLTDGRNHGRHAAAVRQTQIQDGRVRIELLAEAIGDHFKAGLQRAIVKADAGQRLNLPVLLNPYRASRDSP